jgi:NTE family protein
VINSADLRTQTVFRFTREGAGSWRSGKVVDRVFLVSEAVAASAAFPVLLPAIDRELEFDQAGGRAHGRVILTDGGVYDNLGVKVFDPVRPPRYSFGAIRVDTIIACIAETGLPTGEAVPRFLVARLMAAFATVHRQLHTAEFGMLHSWLAAGQIQKLVMPYLGQDDSKLPPLDGARAPTPLGTMRDYPVDFKSMPNESRNALSGRGYDQTRRLLCTYMSEFDLGWPEAAPRA